MSKLNMLMKSV